MCFRLDGSGTFDTVQEEQRKAVEERIAAASSGKTLEDLTFDKMQQIRSFYTQVCSCTLLTSSCCSNHSLHMKHPHCPSPPLKDEMAAFKKPSKKKLVKRKRSSLAEELEATAGAGASARDAQADHGSRSSKPVAESTAKHVRRCRCSPVAVPLHPVIYVFLQDILQGRERYERALAAAQLQSVQLLSGGGDDQVRPPLALLLSFGVFFCKWCVFYL